MTEFVKVKAQALEFGALDWCIAQIEKLKLLARLRGDQ